MRMKMTMLRAFIAGLVGAVTALAAVGAGGGQPGSAGPCPRAVAIDPQMTISEGGGTLAFIVRTNSCAVAGSVLYRVLDGSAQLNVDYFTAESGQLVWQAGDVSYRKIRVFINDDKDSENLLEDFRIVLFNPSENVRIAGPQNPGQAPGQSQGRIFDNDMQPPGVVTDDRICLVSGEKTCLPERPQQPGTFSGPAVIQTMEPGNTVIAPIVLDMASPVDEVVFFQTASDGLIEGTDFVGVHEFVTIPAGQTLVEVPIELMSGAYSKPGQSFSTHILRFSAGVIVDGDGVVTMVG